MLFREIYLLEEAYWKKQQLLDLAEWFNHFLHVELLGLQMGNLKSSMLEAVCVYKVDPDIDHLAIFCFKVH